MVRLDSLDFEVLENLIQSTFSNEVLLKTDSLLDFRTKVMAFIKNLTLILFGREMQKESEEVFKRFGFKKTSLQHKDFKDFLKENHLTIEHFREMLLIDAFSIIEVEKEIRDKEDKKNILEQFIAEIGTEYWHYFYFDAGPETKIDLIQALNEKLIKLLYSVHIGDYLSLLFMELAQNAEKSHYEYILAKEFQIPQENLSPHIKEKENRLALQKFIREKDLYLKAEFLFFQEPDFHKMVIKLYNFGLIEKSVENKLQEKMNQTHSQKSLGEFFEDSDNLLGAGLGLFYVSYIKEECENQGFIFDSYIQSFPEQEEVCAVFEFLL